MTWKLRIMSMEYSRTEKTPENALGLLKYYITLQHGPCSCWRLNCILREPCKTGLPENTGLPTCKWWLSYTPLPPWGETPPPAIHAGGLSMLTLCCYRSFQPQSWSTLVVSGLHLHVWVLVDFMTGAPPRISLISTRIYDQWISLLETRLVYPESGMSIPTFPTVQTKGRVLVGLPSVDHPNATKRCRGHVCNTVFSEHMIEEMSPHPRKCSESSHWFLGVK